MEDNKKYFGKLSRIVIDMGEKISNSEVVAKLLRSVSKNLMPSLARLSSSKTPTH